jgi:hypothetical protein
MQLYCTYDELTGSVWATTVEHAEALTSYPVIVFEERFQLFEPFTAKIIDVSYGALVERRCSHAEQPIVSRSLPGTGLLGFYYTDQRHFDQATDERRCFVDDHYVYRIAVLCSSTGNETEIVWKGAADSEGVHKFEQP